MGWVNDKGANSAPQFKEGGKVNEKSVAEKNKEAREKHKKGVKDKAQAGKDRRDARKARRKKWKAYPPPPELPQGGGRD